MTLLPLNPDELLSTTRAVRKRLDFDRAVPRSLVEECIDVAFQAPTGGNRQGWHFMVVQDEAKKKAIAELYAKAFIPYVNSGTNLFADGDTRSEHYNAVRNSATYLSDNFHRAPYMVIPVMEGRSPDSSPVFAQAGLWGSLLPAFWRSCLPLEPVVWGPLGQPCTWCTSEKPPKFWGSLSTNTCRAGSRPWPTQLAPISNPPLGLMLRP